jgi:hypothetical protein
MELQTSVKTSKQDDTTRTRTPKPGYLKLTNDFKTKRRYGRSGKLAILYLLRLIIACRCSQNTITWLFWAPRTEHVTLPIFTCWKWRRQILCIQCNLVPRLFPGRNLDTKNGAFRSKRPPNQKWKDSKSKRLLHALKIIIQIKLLLHEFIL